MAEVIRTLILRREFWEINLSDRIKKIFKNLKEKNNKALISFSVAGFPDDQTSLEICKVLSDSGVHIHELNMPHAEAQADGPIIQLANIKSIKKGINLDKIFMIAEKLRLHNPNLGICLMGYLNNIFIYGIEKFAEKANKAGVDALICVDLPADVKEEKQIRDALKKVGISLIKLITPTTNENRIKEITMDAESFIYSVNLKGITGVKTVQVNEANQQIDRIKKYTNLPIVSGFGIKNPQDAKEIAKSNCDGVVVGSQIVKYIQENIDDKNLPQKVGSYVKTFVEVLK